MKPLLLTLGLLLAHAADAAVAPNDLTPITCGNCAEWNEPHAPFTLFGKSYFVGPEGISVVAIDSGDGVILLDGALPQSVDLIVANLSAIGLRIEDVKYIGISHAHFDHVGGVAALARLSGATVLATAAGKQTLQEGNVDGDDPQAGYGDAMKFPAVKKVKSLADGESITLGAITLTLHSTPGHTPGGSSWTWRSCEADRCVNMVHADSLNPVSHDDFHFADAGRAEQFRASISKLRNLPCDLMVSAHPSQSRLFDRASTGTLIDASACRAYADDAERRLSERLAAEAATKQP